MKHTPSFRLVSNLRLAHRCAPQPLPKPSSLASKSGLRYERNVVKAFQRNVDDGRIDSILHNPWYYFEDDNGPGYAVPDIIIQYHISAPLVIAECKRTYVDEVLEKLQNFYCPIVQLASRHDAGVVPLIIVKNVTPTTPEPSFEVRHAIPRHVPLLCYLGKGPIT